jgi:hypothetical protein
MNCKDAGRTHHLLMHTCPLGESCQHLKTVDQSSMQHRRSFTHGMLLCGAQLSSSLIFLFVG